MTTLPSLYKPGVPNTSAAIANMVSDETGSGSLVFNNSPTFGGTIIHNGVAHLVSNTKPTTMDDGDLWYNPSDGTQWFWNGTYWLGSPYTVALATATIVFNTTSTYHIGIAWAKPIFLYKAILPVISSGLLNSSNYFTFANSRIKVFTSGTAANTNITSAGSFSTQSRTTLAGFPMEFAFNAAITYPETCLQYFSFDTTKVGAPGDLYIPGIQALVSEIFV